VHILTELLSVSQNGFCPMELDTRVYLNVSGLAAWSENCKRYSWH